MTLASLRDQIDAINRQLVGLLGKRLEIAKQIARLKKEEKRPVLDAARESLIKQEIRHLAKTHQLSPPIVEEIFQLILDYTKLEMELV